MKRIIFILTFLYIFILQTPGASALECKLKSGPQEGVKEYISDLKTVLNQVNAEAMTYDCGASGTGMTDNIAGNTSKATQTIIADSNKLLDPNGFLSSWEFNMTPIFWGKVPDEFYRDHDYLESQTQKINSTHKLLGKRCALFKQPKSDKLIALAAKYKVDRSSLGSILSGFRTVNINSTALLRCTVVGSISGCESPDKEVFIYEKIKEEYDSAARDACNAENPTLEKLGEDIKKIFNGENGLGTIQKGIKEWQAAIKLLSGVTGDGGKDYEDKERSLLAKELARQGLSATQASAVLKNLKCFNDTDDVLNKCILKNISDGLEGFAKQVSNALAGAFKTAGSTSVPGREKKSITTTDAILKDIASDYAKHEILLKTENKTQETGIANLIQLHQNLIATNKKIEATIKPAEEACNLQGQGEGNCKAR